MKNNLNLNRNPNPNLNPNLNHNPYHDTTADTNPSVKAAAKFDGDIFGADFDSAAKHIITINNNSMNLDSSVFFTDPNQIRIPNIDENPSANTTHMSNNTTIPNTNPNAIPKFNTNPNLY